MYIPSKWPTRLFELQKTRAILELNPSGLNYIPSLRFAELITVSDMSGTTSKHSVCLLGTLLETARGQIFDLRLAAEYSQVPYIPHKLGVTSERAIGNSAE